MVYCPWLSEDALRFIEKLAISDAPPPIPIYFDEGAERGLMRSRSRRSPPRMTGAVPAGRMGERRGLDYEPPDERHTSSDDQGGDDDNDDGTVAVEIPRNPAERANVNLTFGRVPISKREREPLMKGVARPAEVETDDSSDSEKGD